MIGKLSWDIRSGSDVLPVTTGTISIDDQNIPAITASVSVPYDASLLERIDPRSSSVPRVTLIGRMTQWSSRPIGDLSAYAVAQGGTFADLSAAWAGLQFSDVSAMFGTPLNTSAPTEPQSMRLDLHVREISYDDWEMRLDLASDEALLTDWAPSSQADVLEMIQYGDTHDMLRVDSWVNLILGMAIGRSLPDGPYNGDTISSVDAVTVDYGRSGYEMFRPALEDTDLKLRVNRSGLGFTLQRPENELPGKEWFSLLTHREVISAQQVRSRTGDWYDSVALTVDLENGIGFTGYPNGDHTRTYTEKFQTGTPTAAMAQNIVRRTINRGRFIDITAPIRLGVFMRDEFTYQPFDGATGEEYQWAVKAVSYDLQTATMRIRGERRY